MPFQKSENTTISQDQFLNEIKEIRNGKKEVECKKNIYSLTDPSLYAKYCNNIERIDLMDPYLSSISNSESQKYIKYIPHRKKISIIKVSSHFQDLATTFDHITSLIIDDKRETNAEKIRIDDFNTNFLFMEDIIGIDFKRKKTKNKDLSLIFLHSDKYFKLNDLDSFLKNIKKYENLNILDLSRNSLDSISKSIGDLKNLKYLNLSENKLKSLPESIGNLTKLSTLELESNQLKSLPNSIGNLVNLEILNLANNKLMKFPESFNNLKKLKELNLRGNEISEISKNIKNLKIKKLILMNNI